MRGLTALLLATVLLVPHRDRDLTADICVYGASSAGVAASIAAAREGKTVILIEPTAFVGGMSASGVSLVDRGDTSTIGGISREFYERAGAYYGEEIAWRIEPGVARRVFESMLAETSGILVVRGAHLLGVEKRGASIESISLSNGAVVQAKVFIDASYEGDLMAEAGVPFTIGREDKARYGESLAGTRIRSEKHQFNLPVSPYVRKGDPSSGLLPGIAPEPMGSEGDGDSSLPAFTYRLCLTKAANRIPFKKPEGYSPADYELLARYVVARSAANQPTRLRQVVQLDHLPNGKFDLNNNGPLSTDFVGGSHKYARAGLAARREIELSHQRYIEGLFTFLRSDPRLPENLRREAKAFGLAPDEYTDSGNWPPLLYVREARRMMGAATITQAHCEGMQEGTPVGLASYMIDSHNCRRVVVNGLVRNEGDIQKKLPGPFQVPYESLMPNATDCTNLLVPICLSASHVAFSSIRMEPVLMILGQSAGIAASQAIDESAHVQGINKGKLERTLHFRGQILRVNPEMSSP